MFKKRAAQDLKSRGVGCVRSGELPSHAELKCASGEISCIRNGIINSFMEWSYTFASFRLPAFQPPSRLLLMATDERFSGAGVSFSSFNRSSTA